LEVLRVDADVAHPPDHHAGNLDRSTGLETANVIELRRDGKVIKTFNYDELKKQTDPNDKVYVEPNDTIFVPESKF